MPRTIKSLAGVIGLLWLGAAFFPIGQMNAAAPRQADRVPPSAVAASTSAVAPQRALLDKYCVGCHNDRTKVAGLSLQTVDIGRITADNAPILEAVVRKLRSGAMPPAGRPRPDQVTYNGLASWLERELDSAAAAAPNPGGPGIHRLNRAEYANVIRDLLALEIDGRSLLPSDDAAYGFDNIGDFLSMSSSLLERYLFAARKVAYRAVGDAATPAVVETYGLSPYFEQYDRMSEELPFGTRGGLALRHHFPVDGEYIFRVRLKRGEVSRILGLAEENQIDLRLDGARLTQFTIGGEPSVRGADLENNVPREEKAESALNVRVLVKAGTRDVGVALLKKKSALEGLRPAGLSTFFGGGGFGSARGAMGIEGVVIEGPFNATGVGDTPSRHRIFVCRPARSQDEQPCAEKILRTLARRAYRRLATDEDVETLMTFYKAGHAKGGFEAGIRRALERLLVEPDFLYRIEAEPPDVAPGDAFRINGFDLASRLSFFLWSSIPDDELLDLAEMDKLKDAVVLDHQVRRMLADSRSDALVSNFAAQWLFLRNVQAAKPDRYAFPEFDDNLREAFQRETELFMESQLREDRSLVELLTANYTFVNERLAAHYGIPDVYGNRFRRVTFSDDRRAGLLGQGSILMVTSHPNRTSPVVRGKWLLENILGAPPPPPPPNVPPLEENDERGGKGLTVRERMEQHRKNPVCASCHVVMDPFGLVLENFDAIGRWRTTEAGTPIDASVTLPDGVMLQGPTSLRQVLAGRREEFVTAVTRKLLTYALGRGVEYYDSPAIRKIVREAAPDYHWSAIVLGIAKSTPFQMRLRRSEP